MFLVMYFDSNLYSSSTVLYGALLAKANILSITMQHPRRIGLPYTLRAI